MAQSVLVVDTAGIGTRDRASMAASQGHVAGKNFMSPPFAAVAVVLILLSCAPAQAQDAPLRGIRLLALNGADSQGPAGARQTLLESPDGGGGSPTRNGRGAGDIGSVRRSHDDDTRGPMLPDALPAPEMVPHADPSTPAASTPKRPSYRWQSLVPGAIK